MVHMSRPRITKVILMKVLVRTKLMRIKLQARNRLVVAGGTPKCPSTYMSRWWSEVLDPLARLMDSSSMIVIPSKTMK